MDLIAHSLKTVSVTYTDIGNTVQFNLDIDEFEFANIRAVVDTPGRYFLAGVIGFTNQKNLQLWPISSISPTSQTIFVEVLTPSHADDEATITAYSHVLYQSDFDIGLSEIYSELKLGKDITVLVEIDHFNFVEKAVNTWRVSNRPFISLPTDSSPCIPFDDAILPGGLTYETNINIPESTDSEFYFGALQNEGKLIIDNSTGNKNSWFLQNSIESCEIRIFIGTGTECSFDNFVKFKKYIAIGFDIDSTEKIKINLRSPDFLLDVPLQTEKTIRNDGSDGELIPVVYGFVAHAEPPQVPAGVLDSEKYELVLQVGEGHIYSIESVRDSGDGLIEGLDYDVFTDSEKSYCLIGIIAPPYGRLTIQIGAPDEPLPNDFICFPADIVRHVLLNFTTLTEDNLDLISFETHKLINNILVGYYITEHITVNNFVDTVLRDCGSIKYWTNENKLRIVHVPIFSYPTFFTNFNQISKIDTNNIVVQSLTVKEIRDPIHSITVGFAKNYAVLGGGDFAGNVDLQTREILSNEFYYQLESTTKIGFGLILNQIISRQDIGLDYVLVIFSFLNESARIGFENANVLVGDWLVIYNVGNSANFGKFKIIDIEYNPPTRQFTIIIPFSSPELNDETPELGLGKISMSDAEASRPGYPSALRINMLDTGLGRLRAADVMVRRLISLFTLPSIIVNINLATVEGAITVGSIIEITNNINNYLNLNNKYGIVLSESVSFTDTQQQITVWFQL